ncbi:MAG: hypothetical protein V7785_22435 [Bermanella sp.]
MQKTLMTLGILIYAVLIPILEISPTHVFNPDWPAHALLHEVWQLMSNSMIGMYCLWLIWKEGKIFAPSLISLLVMGGFLMAFALRNLYGGSMVHSDGNEIALSIFSIGEINLGVLIATMVSILFSITLLGTQENMEEKLAH